MTEQIKALRKLVIVGATLMIFATPLAMLFGYLLEGQSGMYGAGIGFGLAVVFIGITALVALATQGLSVQSLGYAVLGSWLLKVVMLISVLTWLRNEDFYHRPSLFISLLLGLVGYLTIEAAVTLTSRVTYLDSK